MILTQTEIENVREANQSYLFTKYHSAPISHSPPSYFQINFFHVISFNSLFRLGSLGLSSLL